MSKEDKDIQLQPVDQQVNKLSERPEAAASQKSASQTSVNENKLKYSFGREPMQVTCKGCHANVITIVRFNPSCKTWFCCLAMFLTGLSSFGCCLIPFCINRCKRAAHFCPNCNIALGQS